MKKLRTKLGNALFKKAHSTYSKNHYIGNKLFKLAALVSPNK